MYACGRRGMQHTCSFTLNEGRVAASICNMYLNLQCTTEIFLHFLQFFQWAFKSQLTWNFHASLCQVAGVTPATLNRTINCATSPYKCCTEKRNLTRHVANHFLRHIHSYGVSVFCITCFSLGTLEFCP